MKFNLYDQNFYTSMCVWGGEGGSDQYMNLHVLLPLTCTTWFFHGMYTNYMKASATWLFCHMDTNYTKASNTWLFRHMDTNIHFNVVEFIFQV
jgi:hypothetical protein